MTNTDHVRQEGPVGASWRLVTFVPLAMTVLDVLGVSLAMWCGYAMRFQLEVGSVEIVADAPFSEYAKPLALLAVLIPCLLWWRGLYQVRNTMVATVITTEVFRAVLLGTVLVLALLFFAKPPHAAFTYSRLSFFYFAVVGTLLLSVAHRGGAQFCLWRYRNGYDLRRALIIGGPNGHLAEKLAHDPVFGLAVLGRLVVADQDCGDTEQGVDRRPSADGEPDGSGSYSMAGAGSSGVGVLLPSAKLGAKRASTVAVLGTLAEVRSVVETRAIEEVVILDQGLTHEQTLDVLDVCEPKGVRVRLVPPVYDLLIQISDLFYVHGVPIIRLDERKDRRLSSATKRVVDFTIAFVALLVLLPVILAIVVAIKVTSAGDAVFSQVRAGKDGRAFRMYKFRTMVADAEERLSEVVDLDGLDQPVFKIENDHRVTRVGRLLRRASLDELPQLWNVLRGDMSLVGPRPEELRLVERYDVWQRRRLKVKPGITGLQQVEARGSLSTLKERVPLDVFYIRHQSLLLDVVILLRTVAVVLHGRGAS